MLFFLKRFGRQASASQIACGTVLCAIASALMGCAQSGGLNEFFARKPTELDSKLVLRDIARVRENPHIYNPLPEMYRTEPQRLQLDDGVRMFYFTKHHPASEISDGLKKLGFAVSQNPNTNQVIIHAADIAECDRIEEYLAKTDVPPIQVHIDCIILERYGDVTKDWETTILIENLFGEKVTLGEDKYPNAALPGASLREAQRSTFGLDFGVWKNEGIPGHQIRAIVDVLESRGVLKILLNPTLEIVNGKTAKVEIRDRAPIEKTVTERNQVYKVTDYQWVSDTLQVTPYVYADGMIGLKTSITIGSTSKPEGVVQASIITQRSIDVAENRISPGKSLIIGGMRKSETLSIVRGVPFFKDLPIIGALFSSKDFEERATEIIFILTPSISAGGVHYSEMADMIRQKHRNPEPDSTLEEFIRDPLAGEVYLQYVEEQSEQAKADAVRFERERARAEFMANEERLRQEAAVLQAQSLQAQFEEAKAKYDEFVAQAKAAQAQAEAAAKEAQAQQAIGTQAQEEIQKAAEVSAQAAEAALKAQAEREAARQRSLQASERAKQTQQQAEAAKAKHEALLKEIAEWNAQNPPPPPEPQTAPTPQPETTPQPEVVPQSGAETEPQPQTPETQP